MRRSSWDCERAEGGKVGVIITLCAAVAKRATHLPRGRFSQQVDVAEGHKRVDRPWQSAAIGEKATVAFALPINAGHVSLLTQAVRRLRRRGNQPASYVDQVSTNWPTAGDLCHA